MLTWGLTIKLDQNRTRINFEVIDVVDFFCGCGGTSAGLKRAGLNILAGIDFDRDCEKTFTRNFPEASFLLTDIRSLEAGRLGEIIPRLRTRPLLFSACAPCQPFSKQKTLKRDKDERLELLDEFHRFVTVFRPDYLFVENVPGLQKKTTQDSPLSRFVGLLTRLGYQFDFKTPSSQSYGVPQVRKRLVLVASLIGDISVAEPTHGPGTPVPEYATVWEWIGDLPALAAGASHPSIPNHTAAALSDLNLQRMKATPEGGSRLDWPESLRLNCHKGQTVICTFNAVHQFVEWQIWSPLSTQSS